MTLSPPTKVWPIMFADPLLRALLAGRKTQSRRLPTPMWHNVARQMAAGVPCRLYVREAFGYAATTARDAGDPRVIYRATAGGDWPSSRWRPAIHMPRRHSRMTLGLTEVRREQLQDISHDDAVAEGVEAGGELPRAYGAHLSAHQLAFARLWDQLHTRAGGTWTDDPEVVVLAFRVHNHNIDRMADPR